MKTNWKRIGLRLWERALLVLMLVVTIAALARVPAFMTKPVTHLPEWWNWEWVPPNQAVGVLVSVLVIAGWVQYGIARYKLNGIISRKAQSHV